MTEVGVFSVWSFAEGETSGCLQYRASKIPVQCMGMADVQRDGGGDFLFSIVFQSSSLIFNPSAELQVSSVTCAHSGETKL